MAKVFNIDWSKFHQQLMPLIKRKVKNIEFIAIFITQVKRIDDWFRSFRLAMHYRLNHTSQIIYMEKMLNDYFDANDRRIYIGDGDFAEMFYVYNKDRLLAVFIYNKWNSQTNYLEGNRVSYNGVDYRASQDNTNFEPGQSPVWTPISDTVYIRDKDNYGNTVDFIVFVPIEYQSQDAEIREKINYYKLFNRNYDIQYF